MMTGLPAHAFKSKGDKIIITTSQRFIHIFKIILPLSLRLGLPAF